MNQHYFELIKSNLSRVSSQEKAESSRCYFPNGIVCIGATASDINDIIRHFQTNNESSSHGIYTSTLSADDTLSLCEYILQHAEFNEEKLIAFGLLNKFVKKHYNDELLLRFEFWLEHYTNNWCLVDDLCIKTIYQFLLTKPHLITQTTHWKNSKSPWCRRASNVVWVKFIKRKIGKLTYALNTHLIFKHCDALLTDNDEFVQKSIGWLLKVTAKEHEALVIKYIKLNYNVMQRSTMRTAIEKMDVNTRKNILNNVMCHLQ